MNPLLPLASLAADIKQFVRRLSDLERCLRDSCCLYATVQDILVGEQLQGFLPLAAAAILSHLHLSFSLALS